MNDLVAFHDWALVAQIVAMLGGAGVTIAVISRLFGRVESSVDHVVAGIARVEVEVAKSSELQERAQVQNSQEHRDIVAGWQADPVHQVVARHAERIASLENERPDSPKRRR